MRRFEEIIVHCGLPKTGSTSLQVALGAKRSELAEAGYLFPEFPGTSDNHAYPVLQLAGNQDARPLSLMAVHDAASRDRMTKLWAQMASGELAPSCNRLIISAEALWLMDVEEAFRVFEFLESLLTDSGQIRAVGWVRHPVLWLGSLRNEYSRHGHGLKSAMATLLNSFQEHGILFLADTLKERFPHFEWDLLRFEDARAQGGVESVFWELFNLPGDPPALVESNVSLCGELLALFSDLGPKGLPAHPQFISRNFTGIRGTPAEVSASEAIEWWNMLGDRTNKSLKQWGLPPYAPVEGRGLPPSWPLAFFADLEARLDELNAPGLAGRVWWGIQVELRTKGAAWSRAARRRVKWHCWKNRKAIRQAQR